MKKQYDPRMHSAEHILNQTLDRMFHCGRCFSAHIEKKKSKCDYHFNRALTQNEVEEIQTRVNRVIQEDLPVIETYITRTEAGQRYHIEKLPADAGDRIRIISMGHYDACPCIGPHIKTTSEIGTFRITTTSFEDGVLRIRYKLARSDHQ
jgi:Ser-tRNA(Ala) deacylase AlaX